MEYEDGRVIVRAKARFGLLEVDIVRFVASSFGVEAEVLLYE